MKKHHSSQGAVRHAGTAIIGSLLAILVLAACGDPGPVKVGDTTPAAVESVTVQGENHTVEMGGFLTLEAVVEATGSVDTSVAWSSGNEAVAEIDQDGVVTGIAVGTTIITATSIEDATKYHAVMLEVTQPFTLVINTNLGSSTTFQLGLGGEGTITVDWGDGHIEDVVDPDNLNLHEYAEHGTYTITVIGHLEDGSFGPSSTGNIRTNAQAMTKLESWGDLGITNLRLAFVQAENLTSVPDSLPPGTTNIAGMLEQARSFNGDVSRWDTSSVTNMRSLFRDATSFNQDVSGWDTSSVTDMGSLFRDATSFNQDVSGWDTSSVTDMGLMFKNASAFDSNIGGWSTGNVDTMIEMFSGAERFNQDIRKWNTGNVTSMSRMFQDASSFNQPIGDWDTSSVQYMRAMFENAIVFNRDLQDWDTSNVTNMDSMFHDAAAFSQDLSAWGWCVEKIKTRPTNFGVEPAKSPEWGTCPR